MKFHIIHTSNAENYMQTIAKTTKKFGFRITETPKEIYLFLREGQISKQYKKALILILVFSIKGQDVNNEQ